MIAAVIRHGEQTFDGYLMGSHGVGDLLIGRFKERVENVRLDVMDCFTALIKRFSIYSPQSENSSDPRMGDMEVIEDSQSSLVESVSVDASHIHFFVSHTAKIAKKCKVLFAASKGGSSGDDAKTRVAALGVIRMLAVAMQVCLTCAVVKL